MSAFTPGLSGRTRSRTVVYEFELQTTLAGIVQLVLGRGVAVWLSLSGSPGSTTLIGRVGIGTGLGPPDPANDFVAPPPIYTFTNPAFYVGQGQITITVPVRQRITLQPNTSNSRLELNAVEEITGDGTIEVDWNGTYSGTWPMAYSLPTSVDEQLVGFVGDGATCDLYVRTLIDGDDNTGDSQPPYHADGIFMDTGKPRHLSITNPVGAPSLYGQLFYQENGRDAGIDGVLRCFETPFPDPARLRYESLNSVKTVNFTGGQHTLQFRMRNTASSMPGFVPKNLYGFHHVNLPSSYYSTNYGDTVDGTIIGLSTRWPVMTLAFDKSYPVTADSISSTGTISVTTITGGFRATPGASGATVSFNWTAPIVPQSYRYLEVHAKADTAGSTCKIEIGGKKWLLTLSTTLDTYQLDLCTPDEASSWVDDQDSFWPLVNVGGTLRPQYEKAYWGINYTSEIKVTTMATGVEYTVQDLRFFAKENPIVELISAQASRNEYTAGNPVSRGFIVLCDGKAAAEYPLNPPSGSGTATTLRDYLNAIPGWTATLLGYTGGNITGDNTSMGEMAQGAGYDTAWRDTCKIEISGTVTLYGALRYDQLFTHIACGDPITGVGYGSNDRMWFRWARHLRSRLWGLSHDASHLIAETSISLKRISDDKLGGMAVYSAPPGAFDTYSPYAQHLRTYKVMRSDGTELFDRLMTGRYRVRGNLEALGAAGAPWHIQDRWGRLHLASVKGGDIHYKRSSFSTQTPDWAVDTQVTAVGDATFAAMDIDRKTDRILMLVERLSGSAYSLYSTYSDDDGATWAALTSFMANARFGVPFEDHDGGTGYTWFEYDSGTSGPGTQKAQYRGPGDDAYGATYTFKDSSGADISVADGGWSCVRHARDNEGRFTWTPIIDSETEPSIWESTDHAVTWGRV